MVTALYFVSVFSMSNRQAELAQLHPTTCPQLWVTCYYIFVESTVCKHLSVKLRVAKQGKI